MQPKIVNLTANRNRTSDPIKMIGSNKILLIEMQQVISGTSASIYQLTADNSCQLSIIPNRMAKWSRVQSMGSKKPRDSIKRKLSMLEASPEIYLNKTRQGWEKGCCWNSTTLTQTIKFFSTKIASFRFCPENFRPGDVSVSEPRHHFRLTRESENEKMDHLKR